jgi:hypothetical protein
LWSGLYLNHIEMLQHTATDFTDSNRL